MTGLTRRLRNCSRGLAIGMAILAVGVIGTVDYLTGHEMSFSVFYLLGVGLAAWFVGRGFGALISVLSVTVWITGDIASGAQFSSPFILVWNVLVLLLFYLVVVCCSD